MGESVQDIIIRLIEENVGFKFNLNTLLEELNMDSIDYIELIVEIENNFQIEFEGDELVKSTFNSVLDLIECVQRKVKSEC